MERKRVAGRFVREAAEVEATGEVGEQEVRRVLTGAPRPKFCRTYTKKRVAEALPAIVNQYLCANRYAGRLAATRWCSMRCG